MLCVMLHIGIVTLSVVYHVRCKHAHFNCCAGFHVASTVLYLLCFVLHVGDFTLPVEEEITVSAAIPAQECAPPSLAGAFLVLSCLRVNLYADFSVNVSFPFASN